ncbi:hypothetical protein [Candidatus Vidania fulgoroideorum]
MSKKGRRYIMISNVYIRYSRYNINILGKYGATSLRLRGRFFLFLLNNFNLIIRPYNLTYISLWGTYFSYISNMCTGVTFMFKDTLIIDGVGYGFKLDLDTLLINIGFSNILRLSIPYGVYCSLDTSNSRLLLRSVDNITLGNFCYIIKNLRKYNPYKKIGIRSLGEFKFLKVRNKKK